MNFLVCPLRNGLSLTSAGLESFLVQDIADVRVLFIDNASTDGTTPWLHTLDERVLTMHFNPPKSVAASWNAGLRWVFDTQPIPGRNSWRPPLAEYALVVNNDVVLRPDAYRRLVEDGGLFVTGVGSDNPKCVEPNQRGHNGEQYFEEPNPSRKRPHPDFSCYLIRRECWQKVGSFDEKFLSAFGEDWDYHLRLHKAGIPAYCLDLPFYHVGAGSQTIKTAEEAEQQRISEQAEKNREYFYRKWGVRGGTPEYYALFQPTAEAQG